MHSCMNLGSSRGRDQIDMSRVFPRPNPKSVRRENILDFPRLWKYLPISRSSFKTIAERLNLHRAIVVLLDLGAPVISRIVCKKNNEEYKGKWALRIQHFHQLNIFSIFSSF